MFLYLIEDHGSIHHDAEWMILDDIETKIRCREISYNLKIVRNRKHWRIPESNNIHTFKGEK